MKFTLIKIIIKKFIFYILCTHFFNKTKWSNEYLWEYLKLNLHLFYSTQFKIFINTKIKWKRRNEKR